MSAWEATGWSLLRAIAVGLVVAALVRPLLKSVSHQCRWRWFAVVVIAMPAVIPGLLLGYAYRPEGLRWVLTRWRADCLEAVLSAARVMPWSLLVAAVVGVADHGRRDAVWEQTRSRRTATQHQRGRRRLAFERSRGVIAAGLVAALWTFGESEVAALLQARGWPEWTFRRLAGGWETQDVARALLPAIAIVAALVVGVALTVSGRERDGGLRLSAPSRLAAPLTAIYGLVVVVVVGVIPVGRLVADALDGLTALTSQRALVRDVVSAIVAAAVTSAAATWLASRLVSRRRSRIVVGGLLVTFGAMGPLLASVVVQSVIHRTPFGSTVVPQYGTLTLVLLPIAIVLRAVMHRRASSRHAQVTNLLCDHPTGSVRARAKLIRWRATTGPSVACWGLLYWTAFWDLQVAAQLAPPGYATAPARLYNLAHYGQSETLAAILLSLTFVAFAIPLVVLILSRVWASLR